MQVVRQRRNFDCGVACVAMWCHTEYADAFYVAARLAGNGRDGIRAGLSGKQIQAIARRLKCPLRRVHHRKVDIEEDEGILGVIYARTPRQNGHWVVLRRGTIIDPDTAGGHAIWDAEHYLKQHRMRVGMLLAD